MATRSSSRLKSQTGKVKSSESGTMQVKSKALKQAIDSTPAQTGIPVDSATDHEAVVVSSNASKTSFGDNNILRLIYEFGLNWMR